jgi:stromal membrane-associated protein
VTAPQSSVFNLTPSQPVPKAQPAPAATSAWGSNFDALGSNDAWSSAKPAQAQAQAPAANDFGWGSMSSPVVAQISNGISSVTAPKVSADEEFGGWSSAAPPTPGKGASQGAVKPAAGFGAASEDLFSNVWQ